MHILYIHLRVDLDGIQQYRFVDRGAKLWNIELSMALFAEYWVQTVLIPLDLEWFFLVYEILSGMLKKTALSLVRQLFLQEHFQIRV